MFRTRHAVLILMIAVAGAMRVLDHPWNLAPVGALALFAGAHFRDRRLAFIVPLATMFLSDVALGIINGRFGFYALHPLLPWVYACYVVYVFLGEGIAWTWRAIDERARRATSGPEVPTATGRKARPWAWKAVPVAAATLAGAVVFFLVTNFGDWLIYYDRSWRGLVECFGMAIPFFRTTLAGDAIYVAILFGGYAVLRERLAFADEHGLLRAE